MFTQLTDGFFCNPKLVAVVKATGEEESALFTVGQSAVDGGFKLNYRAEDVVAALEEEDGGEEEEEEEEEE